MMESLMRDCMNTNTLKSRWSYVSSWIGLRAGSNQKKIEWHGMYVQDANFELDDPDVFVPLVPIELSIQIILLNTTHWCPSASTPKDYPRCSCRLSSWHFDVSECLDEDAGSCWFDACMYPGCHSAAFSSFQNSTCKHHKRMEGLSRRAAGGSGTTKMPKCWHVVVGRSNHSKTGA
jgi:hypothetical protein